MKYKEYVSSFISNKFNKQNIPEYLKKTTILDKNAEIKPVSFSLN